MFFDISKWRSLPRSEMAPGGGARRGSLSTFSAPASRKSSGRNDKENDKKGIVRRKDNIRVSGSLNEMLSHANQRKVASSLCTSNNETSSCPDQDDAELSSPSTTLEIDNTEDVDDHDVDSNGTARSPCLQSNAEEELRIHECVSSISSFMLTPFRDESGHPLEVLRGFCSIFLLGIVLGLISPSSPHHSDGTFSTSWYPTVSKMMGYVYTLCWSVAFYPQVLLNYRRKTTQGLSADFILLNVVGFAGYAIYAGVLLWSTTIRQVYEMKMHQYPTVQLNDFILCAHVWLVSVFVCFQIFIYDGFVWTRDITRPNQWLLSIMVLVGVAYPIILVLWLSLSHNNGQEEEADEQEGDDKVTTSMAYWLNYLYLLSYMKVLTTLVKYVPQALLNWNRKSTVVWNIWRSLLDVTGGLLSIAQLVGDAAYMGDWKAGVMGNPAKLGLGIFSIIFSAIFIFQHYVLYPEKRTEPSPSQQDTVPLVQNDMKQHVLHGKLKREPLAVQ